MGTLYDVCSVHRGVFSISGDTMSTLGDIMSTWAGGGGGVGDIMMNVGDTMSTSVHTQYIGGTP